MWSHMCESTVCGGVKTGMKKYKIYEFIFAKAAHFLAFLVAASLYVRMHVCFCAGVLPLYAVHVSGFDRFLPYRSLERIKLNSQRKNMSALF